MLCRFQCYRNYFIVYSENPKELIGDTEKGFIVGGQ